QIYVDNVLATLTEKYKSENITTIDGVKIDFPTEWVHLRKSNTEPIIRIYAESKSQTTAENLAEKIISDIKEMIKK
ncbi:MAG: phosphoglucosamine mutase, partial [Bacteroidota bacterium]